MDHTSPGTFVRTERYGPHVDQIGDLYIPSRLRPPIICLLHGGFWRMPYGRDQMSALAQDLAERGFAVWNLEYRRSGINGGGWPYSFEDVTKGLEHLSHLAGEVEIDLSRLVVVGHSAGGQLALVSATIDWKREIHHGNSGNRIAAIVGQAPLVDLIQAYELGVGGSAIADYFGGSPHERYSQYLQASPIMRLPLGIPQLILHGTADDVVPFDLSRGYVQAARNSGDQAELIELAGLGHMDFLDPSSAAHTALCSWLTHLV